jgi:predicted metal-dependent phosphoesterase TrpH
MVTTLKHGTGRFGPKRVTMVRRRHALLAELHAHTTWSDGELTPAALVDLYGEARFDVVAITDHVVASARREFVRAETFAAYLEEIDAEAERARSQYGLLVVPGLELTVEDQDPARAAHAVAIGLRRFVGVDDGLDEALRQARAAGAALVAAHPYSLTNASSAARITARFACEPEWAAGVVDRFELVNRDEVFGWVAARRLPAVASGDFHRPEHLTTWKTLLNCRKNEEEVVAELRSRRPCALTRVDGEGRPASRAA